MCVISTVTLDTWAEVKALSLPDDDMRPTILKALDDLHGPDDDRRPRGLFVVSAYLEQEPAVVMSLYEEFLDGVAGVIDANFVKDPLTGIPSDLARAIQRNWKMEAKISKDPDWIRHCLEKSKASIDIPEDAAVDLLASGTIHKIRMCAFFFVILRTESVSRPLMPTVLERLLRLFRNGGGRDVPNPKPMEARDTLLAYEGLFGSNVPYFLTRSSSSSSATVPPGRSTLGSSS